MSFVKPERVPKSPASPSESRQFVIDLKAKSPRKLDESQGSGHESHRKVPKYVLRKHKSKKILSKKQSLAKLKRNFTFKNLVKTQSKKNFLEEQFPMVENNNRRSKLKSLRGERESSGNF